MLEVSIPTLLNLSSVSLSFEPNKLLCVFKLLLTASFTIIVSNSFLFKFNTST